MIKRIVFILLIVGVALRFYFQFLSPSFSGDEIALGNNVKSGAFIDLLYPFENFQSAPPLYLLLLKVFVQFTPVPFWISIKILNFVVSVLILYLAYRIAIKRKWGWLSILWMVFFIFNPYVIYNTLTVKQYGFDLLGVMILLLSYKQIATTKKGFWFFLLWPLFSNVGLFFCPGFVLIVGYRWYQNLSEIDELKRLFLVIGKMFPYTLGCILYVLFFVWFMNQKGAAETKVFMENYWGPIGGFFPLNSGILGFTAMFLFKLSTFFFSSYEILALVFMSLLLFTIIGLIVKRNHKNGDMLAVLIMGIVVHFILNLLRIYPLLDRLYLYWFPIMVFLIIQELEKFKINKSSIAISIIMGISYTTYIRNQGNDNDVVSVYKCLKLKGASEIYTTEYTAKELNNFHTFTDNWFNRGNIQIELYDFEKENRTKGFFVSKVNSQFGYNRRTASEPTEIQQLINEKKIALFEKVNGYNIYTID